MKKSLIPEVKIKIDNEEIDKSTFGKFVKLKVSLKADGTSMAIINFYDSRECEDSIFTLGTDVGISLGYSQKFKILFSGEISHISYNFASNEGSQIELTCSDKLIKLARVTTTEVFKQMKYSDIAKKLANKVGLKTDIDDTVEVIPSVTKYNQSDLTFLKEIAEKKGYEVACDDDKFIFKKVRVSKQTKGIDLILDDNLIDFDAQLDAKDVLSEVTVSAWDPVTKSRVKSSAKVGNKLKDACGKIQGKAIKPNITNKMYIEGKEGLSEAEAKKIAEEELDRSSRGFLSGSGTCVGDPDLKPAIIVMIKNIGKNVDADFYVTSCEHIYSLDGYTTSFNVIDNVS